MKRKILFVLLAVFVISLAVLAYLLISYMLDYSKADEFYAGLQEEVVEVERVPSQPSNGEEQSPIKETASAPIAVRFDRLLEKNKDVVGWLYCEGTAVNYPVVQGDSNEQYIHTGLDGAYLRSGTLFLDCLNDARPMVDKNTIIYGHSMRNNSMFGILLDYKKQSFFDRHPVWYYLTPNGNYRVELIAGAVARTHRDIFCTLLNAEVMVRELAVLKEMSTFKSNVTYTKEDTFITLSTCSYEFDDARFVVVGKLVPLD